LEKGERVEVILQKIFAFIKRDFNKAISYRLSFILQFFGIFLTIFTFYFLSRLFGSATIPYLKSYGGDYFSFVLIGIAFSGYLQVSLRSLSTTIRDAQMTGTLESLLVTQTGIPTIILASSAYSFGFTSFRVIAYLFIGVFFFGVTMSWANIPAAVMILLLTISSFGCIGIISASFVMIFKQGDPISWVLTMGSILLGGIYYPITVLPGWLQKVSFFLPITHSLEGMRLTLLQGYSFDRIVNHVIFLVIFTAVMLPMSIFFFSYAIKRAKKEGSLIQY
jgi:ABC-2 type transport system permease protein